MKNKLRSEGRQQVINKWLKSLVKVLIITLAASTIVVVIGLIARWQTAVQFSNGLFWAGVVVGGIGVLGSFGDNNLRFNAGVKYLQSPPEEKYSQLSGAENENARVKRSTSDSGKSFKSYFLFFISATLIILIGYLVTVVFKAS